MKFEVKIVQLPSKVLRQKSKDVKIPLGKEDELLAQQMIYHVTDSIKPHSKFRPAVGVAAVQYGILKNMFFVHLTDENNEIIFSDVIINPKIIGNSEQKAALSQGEGCLSVAENNLGQDGLVRRFQRIILQGFSYYEKKEKVFDCKGYLAIVFQHELDHLLGKLFIDHIKPLKKWEAEKELILL